jgi:hypothetical protein
MTHAIQNHVRQKQRWSDIKNYYTPQQVNKM